MLVLLGVAVVVAGFALRLNPLAVVVAAAVVTGLLAGMDPLATLAVLGKAFRENRYVSVIWLILPLIGLLEREGLQERAKTLIGRLKGATTGRLLLVYMAVRQGTAALGLTSLGGHAQMVRPLVAPMAEAAAEQRHGSLSDAVRHRIRAFAASADNVGVFFGEDIFIAIASVLLIKGFLETNGIVVEPLDVSRWAIPTALAALVIHGARLLLLDRRVARDTKPETEAGQ
jgi:uncharacterized membrane protein